MSIKHSSHQFYICASIARAATVIYIINNNQQKELYTFRLYNVLTCLEPFQYVYTYMIYLAMSVWRFYWIKISKLLFCIFLFSRVSPKIKLHTATTILSINTYYCSQFLLSGVSTCTYQRGTTWCGYQSIRVSCNT